MRTNIHNFYCSGGVEQTAGEKEIADEIKRVIDDQIPETAAAATVPLEALDKASINMRMNN